MHKEEAVAIYLRLSREDEEKETESESIKNQRDFLLSFADNRGYRISGIYTDDGYSGTNFDRPGFKKLISDIEAGIINTVITKDLSRLGRDYIQTGYYLEKYFPSKKVRFIAVNDGIDTEEENGNNDMSPFRSVINDMYARDISKKIRTALTTKKKNGKFIGSFAPFGYAKDPRDKGHLLVNEENADIVREIYQLFLSGHSLIGIAKILTARNIPTPSHYNKLPTQMRFTGLWNDTMVKRILTNETYIGNLTQNRSKKISYKVKQKVNLKKSDWIIIPGTHEAIISTEDFEAVQKILAQRTYVERDFNKESRLLSGLVYCGNCDSPMTFIKGGSDRIYLVCSTWKKYGKLGLCTSHCIRADYIEKSVLDMLRRLANSINCEEIVDKIIKNSKYPYPSDEKYKSKNRSDYYINLQTELYKDKVRGLISEEQYLNISKKISCEYEEKKMRYENMLMDSEVLKQRAFDFLKFDKLNRSFLLLLVDRIKVLDNKNIQIDFSFKL